MISTVLLYPEAAKGLEKLEDSIRSRMTESLRDLQRSREARKDAQELRFLESMNGRLSSDIRDQQKRETGSRTVCRS